MIKILTISSSKIKTSPFTYYKCIQCKAFGSNLRCPPYAPKWNETAKLINKFELFTIVVSRHFFSEDEIGHYLNGYKDLKRVIGLLVRKYSVISKWETHKTMLDILEKTEGIKLGYSAGRCLYCTKKGCNLDSCNNPTKSFPSLEAAGIDVSATLYEISEKFKLSFDFELKKYITGYSGILHNETFS